MNFTAIHEFDYLHVIILHYDTAEPDIIFLKSSASQAWRQNNYPYVCVITMPYFNMSSHWLWSFLGVNKGLRCKSAVLVCDMYQLYHSVTPDTYVTLHESYS
jgi:hypothetical protein